MNTRQKHPHSAQLLKNGLHWSLDPYVGAYGVTQLTPCLSLKKGVLKGSDTLEW
jgi:hypothetical protein